MGGTGGGKNGDGGTNRRVGSRRNAGGESRKAQEKREAENRASGFQEINIEYSPLESQRKFHDSGARFKGFSGPIGSGKSQALCQEAIRLSYLNPGRTGLIGAPTYPMLRDATVAALIDTLDRNGISYEWNRGENYLVMGGTRSRILFRAVEEFERLRGSNLAWFGLDELTYTSEEAWVRLEGRLRDPKASRLCGFAVWTPKGYDWVYRRFVEAPVEGYETVFARPYENHFLLGEIPDYYDRLRRSYDTRFYQQEVLGEYLNLHAGRVYTEFDRLGNVQQAEVDPGKQLYWALDFNVDPMCSVVAQVDGDRAVVLDEIVLSRATTLAACEEFARRFPRHAAGLRVFADASGQRMQTTGSSDLDVLKRFLSDGSYGRVLFSVPRSNPAVKERVQLVNSKLCSAEGVRTLLVSPKCMELIRDFEQVAYKENSQVIDKERDPKRTHLSDALGYLVWQCFGSGRKIGEQNQPLW